jgi:hypothetical protein
MSMSKTDPVTLKSLYSRGYGPAEAYDVFRAEGGHRRKQLFLNEYRQITQQPRAAYNVGGAKRAGVKKPKVEKYENKKEKLKTKPKAKKPAPKKKRSKSHGKKHKGGGEEPPGEGEKANSAKRRGVDVSAHYGAGAPDLRVLKKDLQAHGIKFFRRGGKDALTLAKDGENGTVNLYGTMVYEPSKDTGGRVTGVVRDLIRRAMKKIGRQTTL